MKKMMTILALMALCQGAVLADTRYYPSSYQTSNYNYYKDPMYNFNPLPPEPVKMFTLDVHQPEIKTYLEYNGSERTKSCTETSTAITCY